MDWSKKKSGASSGSGGKKAPAPFPPRSQFSAFTRHEGIILKNLKPENIRQHSLHYIVSRLKEEFPDKNAQLGVCNSIILMLQTPSGLVSRAQKVGAVALLLGLQRKEDKLDYLEDNPFALVLHSLLIGTSDDPADTDLSRTHYIPLTTVEKVILAHLTLDTEYSEQLWTRTLWEVLHEGEDLAKERMPDLSRLERIHEKEMKTLCSAGLDSFLIDLLKPAPAGDPPDLDDNEIPLTLRRFEPCFTTLSPPLHIAVDELCWMPPLTPSLLGLILDTEAGVEEETVARQLFSQALHEALSLTQRQTLLAELQKEPRLVHSLGLTPSKLPSLIQNNPLVAIDVLLRLLKKREIPAYLEVMVQMDISVHSMEVVNRLTTSVELPKDFIHLYVSSCMRRCEGLEDKYVQNRLARLICVFLESLIRNRLIEIQVLYFEIMHFCLEFSRIREAAALYRHIKQLESEEQQVAAVVLDDGGVDEPDPDNSDSLFK